jgi:hypothetical protein
MSEPDRDPSAEVVSLVAAAADEFLARRARGEDPNPEEYIARHPEAAEVIRGVLAVLRLNGGRLVPVVAAAVVLVAAGGPLV